MRQKPCGCGGYWFPHRKGSGTCDYAKDPRRLILLAERYGEDPLQILADWCYDNKGEISLECPF